MTNAKMTKRALISSAISLMLCVSMLLGTTFAWFTDSVTSASNVIQSGNLDITLEYFDGENWVDAEGKVIPFVAADGREDILWEPGCTYEMAPIRVRNEGNLNAKVLILFNDITGDEKLLDVIEFKNRVNNIPESVLNGSAGNQLARFEDAVLDIMYDMREGNIIFDWSLAGKGTVTPGTGHTDTSPEFTLFAHMSEAAGNEYQNLTLEGISITVIATQQTYESDSFNNRYDQGATYPETNTDVISGGETLIAGNVTVTLPDGASKEAYTVNVTNKQITTTATNEKTVSLDISLLKNGTAVEAEENKLYTVAIEVGKNIVLTGVTHKGEAVENYSYNPVTGVVTFVTDSFSPFTVSYSDNVIEISSADEFAAALNEIKASARTQISGGTGNKNYRENVIFVLKNDIVFDSADLFTYTDSNGAALHFYGVKGILNLNGHTITVTENALLSGKIYANAVLLFQYSNVEIVGEGSIVAKNKSIPVYAWANCTVDIYDGNYVTNASERNESAVYVNNATATVNVYGGTYMDSAYAFNVHDNCGTTTTIILHEGITYKNFLKNGTTDVTASDINNGRIAIAGGCELVEKTVDGLTTYTIQTVKE